MWKSTSARSARFFLLLSPYLSDLRVLGCPHDPHHAYVVQDLVHMSDICEAGQRGDLFVRERTGYVVVLESSRKNIMSLVEAMSIS